MASKSKLLWNALSYLLKAAFHLLLLGLYASSKLLQTLCGFFVGIFEKLLPKN
jgi:hypothetical protein